MTRSTRSPATTPGSTELTRMLDGPSSMAHVCVRPASPNLLALYGVRSEKPSRPATDEILMMAPPPARAQHAARAQEGAGQVDVQRLAPCVQRGVLQPAGGTGHAGVVDQRVEPAPSFGQVAVQVQHLRSDDTSPRSRSGSDGCRPARQASASTSQACTRAPDARNLRTIARPMPLAPAVTRMCLSCRDRLMGISGCVWRGALRRTRAWGRPCAAGP